MEHTFYVYRNIGFLKVHRVTVLTVFLCLKSLVFLKIRNSQSILEFFLDVIMGMVTTNRP